MLINSVLDHAAPYTWELGIDYNNKRYALFELNSGDDEYGKETSAFENGNQRINVNTLRRVQNPYQLGSFILRKQQKEFRNETVVVEKWYHPIHRDDMKIALEFNMDVRRYTYKNSGQQDSCQKNPKFYRSPDFAYNAISHSEKMIIICNVLGTGSVYGPIVKENSSEYMPIYIADV